MMRYQRIFDRIFMTQLELSTGPTWTARRVILATLVASAVALGFWLLYHYYIVPFTAFVAIVLGVAIRPAVDWLYARGVPRALGVVIVYLVLLVLLASFVVLLVPLLTEQVTTIFGKLPDYYRGFRDLLGGAHSSLIQRLAQQLPAQFGLPQSQQPGTAPSFNAVAGVFGLVGTMATAVFTAVAILLLGFYWTLDGERTLRGLLLRLQPDQREGVRELIDAMQTKVGAYLIGETIVCVSVGLMALVAYLIIGLPYALVLGLLAGVLEAVPVLGPILGAVPPALLALSVAPDKFIWVVVAVIIIQQVENNLLVPRVMDRSVGVNPIVTILAIAAFASLFGLPGAILAIPLAAIIQVLLNHFVLEPAAAEPELPEGRDRLSILRYQAQDLVVDVRKQVRRKDEVVDNESDRLEDLVEAVASDLDSLLAQAEKPKESL
jgi:predicted PurR-regulated permease PerM